MKRLIAVAVLLLIIIVICIMGKITVTNVCRHATYLATQSEAACKQQDWETADAKSSALSDYLGDKRFILSVFVNHGDVEMLCSKAHALSVLAEEHDSGAFRANIRELLHLLETVSGEQRFDADTFV